MNIFVTGIAGFLGAHLRDALTSLGHNVHGCDIAEPEGIEFDYIPGDCRNLDRMNKWLRNFGTEVVIHCAALPHEGLSVFSPLTIGDSIYRGSVATFSAAISSGVKRIVNMSSMSRYGAIPSPFRETDEPRPADPYAIAKLAAERTLEMLARTHGVEFVTAIPHSIYGPRQTRNDPYRNVVAIMMNRILQRKPPVIYGTGEQRRCFSYIDDVIPCLVQLATTEDRSILYRAINIGPDEGEVSINDLYSMICYEMGYSVAPLYYPDRPAEVRVANCSADLSRRLLGYEAKTSLQEGLSKMADWMKRAGPKPFNYSLPLEIVRDNTPATWRNKEI